jgi:hypothetical protein
MREKRVGVRVVTVEYITYCSLAAIIFSPCSFVRRFADNVTKLRRSMNHESNGNSNVAPVFSSSSASPINQPSVPLISILRSNQSQTTPRYYTLHRSIAMASSSRAWARRLHRGHAWYYMKYIWPGHYGWEHHQFIKKEER